jgi:hypothetical protein
MYVLANSLVAISWYSLVSVYDFDGWNLNPHPCDTYVKNTQFAALPQYCLYVLTV